MVGRHVVEFVHPDELERVALAVDQQGEHGAPRGTTSFRLATADGGWAPVDLTASDVTDGEDRYLAVYCRAADYQHALDEVMHQLLRSAPVLDTLAPVLDAFAWESNGTSVAISWYEPGAGHQHVTTGLPVELTGAEDAPGEPWAGARERFEAVHDRELSLLDPTRQALAAELGRGALWIEPVADARSGIPALITVWGRAEGRAPEGHSYGMSVAKTFVELILRWSGQIARLDAAAHRDPLTGWPTGGRSSTSSTSRAPAGHCSTATSTTSSRSTTGSGTPPATSSCSRSPLASSRARARTAPSPGSEVTSSPSCAPTRPSTRRRRWLPRSVPPSPGRSWSRAGGRGGHQHRPGPCGRRPGRGRAERADRDLYRDKGDRRRRATDPS